MKLFCCCWQFPHEKAPPEGEALILLSALDGLDCTVGGVCTAGLMDCYDFVVVSLALLCCCVLPILILCSINSLVCAVLGSCSLYLVLGCSVDLCPAALLFSDNVPRYDA